MQPLAIDMHAMLPVDRGLTGPKALHFRSPLFADGCDQGIERCLPPFAVSLGKPLAKRQQFVDFCNETLDHFPVEFTHHDTPPSNINPNTCSILPAISPSMSMEGCASGAREILCEGDDDAERPSAADRKICRSEAAGRKRFGPAARDGQRP